MRAREPRIKKPVDRDKVAERQTLRRARLKLAAGLPLTKWQALTVEDWEFRHGRKLEGYRLPEGQAVLKNAARAQLHDVPAWIRPPSLRKEYG